MTEFSELLVDPGSSVGSSVSQPQTWVDFCDEAQADLPLLGWHPTTICSAGDPQIGSVQLDFEDLPSCHDRRAPI